MYEQRSLFDEEEIIEHRKSILISIRNIYFDKMLKGTKHFEYRFTFTKKKTRAYIYIPDVKKHIAGYIDFGIPVWKNVKETCEIYTVHDNGDYEVMEKWLTNKDGCYLIPIEKTFVYERPITRTELLTLEPEFNAPQSFMYLDDKKRLLSLLENRQVIEND
jgi:predicted transcriptional regulator